MGRTLTLIFALSIPAAAAAQAPHASAAKTPPLTEAVASTVAEHLDEAEDIVESLLRWKHLAIWQGEPRQDIPVDAPKNTLISVDRQEVQKLDKLLGAIAAQVTPDTSSARSGDLRAHVGKAQSIARELSPEGGATAKVVTIDRTALQRLEIELDAIDDLLPRATRQS